MLIEYAHYLSPHLYRDVLRAVDMDDEEKLIAILGERKATRLDLRVESFLRRRQELKAVSSVLATKIDRKVEPFPDISNTPRFNADDLPKARPQPAHKVPAEKMQRTLRTPTRSMSHSRSMGPSVQHHNSEPDYLTQAVMMNTVLNNWDDSSHRSHSSHSRHDDVCSTSSYSSHDSHHSSSSWSGDSGGSYDSGSSGGCD
ncbi:hypothetical protein CRX22_10880 [Salmonella enterica subsp. enterica serovar Newport]|nr:hypothetical protein [Salmonella enterica subsp. enterica serovar Newport]